MKKAFFILPVLLLAGNLFLYAQQLVPAKGDVKVVQDERITQLAAQYKKVSRKNTGIDGYRIQIFFESGSNSKRKATEVQAEFEANFPGIQAYLSYKEPNYRVRVGNFRTLIEAVGFQKKILDRYPNCFPVKDRIAVDFQKKGDGF